MTSEANYVRSELRQICAKISAVTLRRETLDFTYREGTLWQYVGGIGVTTKLQSEIESRSIAEQQASDTFVCRNAEVIKTRARFHRKKALLVSLTCCVARN